MPVNDQDELGTTNTMKLKLHIAGWLARRIEKRSRIARRALRDYRRQEGGRIRRDERQSRGLRLYIAWSLPVTKGFHRTQISPQEGSVGTLRGLIPANGHVAQAAH